MTRLLRLTIASLLTLAPLTGRAQSSPLVGSWAIEFTAGMRIENDEPTALRAKGTLIITQVGDSLIATLKVEPNDQVAPRPDARLAAPRSAGTTASFVQRSQARINENGTERSINVISTWTLTITGDALAGTVRREMEGAMMPGMPEQPVTGKRM